jgi:hypothetical protein
MLSWTPYSASTIQNTQATNTYSRLMLGIMTFMFYAGYTWQGRRWKDAPCGPAVNTCWWPYVPPGHSWNLQPLVLPASAIPVFMEFASMTWTGKSVSSGTCDMLILWPFYAVNLCIIRNEENQIFVIRLMVVWVPSHSAHHMVTIFCCYIFQRPLYSFLTPHIGNTHFDAHITFLCLLW